MRDAHLYLHHYPRQEALADLMIESLVTEGIGKPFHRSCVLIQNRGMATWLRQKMTLQHGLCMLVDFPLPGAFLQDCLPHLLEQKLEPMLSQSQLAWMIYTVLPKLITRPSFQTVRRFLEDDSEEVSQRKRLEISDSLAELFDRYQTYRPEWITAWENNQSISQTKTTETWQKELWLELRKRYDHFNHWAKVTDALKTKGITSLKPDLTKLPSTLHVFGISNLPPCYVDLLYVLSHFIPVHVYWMNPVESYWEDAPNRQNWLLDHALTDRDQIKLANPLLASFGRMGREFIGTLYGGAHSNYDWQEQDFQPDEPTPDERDTALEHVQFDIHQNLHAQNLTPDKTLTIHSCYSALREIESVRQHLLHLLATETSIDTSELLVMCPNIEEYTPAIKATFDAIPPDDPHFLPYRISDRTTPAREPSIAAFLEIFQLPNSRFTSKDALSLLEVELVATSFQIQPHQLATLRNWIEQTGIRWGIDREHVRELSEPTSPANWSWEAGLEQLMLGVTMSGNPSTDSSAQLLWNGILPFPDMEGGALALLDSLSSYIAWIKNLRSDLKKPRTLKHWVDWSRLLIVSGFSSNPDAESIMRPVRLALDSLANTAAELDLQEPIHASVFSDQLTAILSKTSPPGGFLSGSITFCEMSPMRAIPTEHLCILGLNAGSYPRPNNSSPFDLTQLERRTGDRSPRDDENYLFLEAILSARSSLYLSYTGSSIKDNTPLPPSSVLQTLIDAYPSLQENLVQEKIHAFSPSYFSFQDTNQDHLLTRSRDQHILLTAQALSEQRNLSPTPVLSLQPVEQSSSVTIQHFLNSLTKTSAFFLRNNLGASSRWLQDLVATDETVELDALESYYLKQQLINNGPLSEQQRLAKQSTSQLPPAEIGQNILQKNTQTIEELLEALPSVHERKIDTAVGNLKFLGSIKVQDEKPDTVQLTSPSSIKANLYITAWVQLLLLRNQTGQPAYAELYSPKDLSPQKIDDPGEAAAQHLATLISIFRQAHQRPLPHFTKTSFSYALETHKAKESQTLITNKQIANRAIRSAWKDQYSRDKNSPIPGESSQVDNMLLHDIQDPISEEFIELSKMIWLPVIQNLHTE